MWRITEAPLFEDLWNFIFSVQSNISGLLDRPQVTFFGEEMFLKVVADPTESS
jgi:hypothetical protein